LDGYCVTSYQTECDAAGKSFQIPHNIHRISDLMPSQSIPEALAMCSNCEAHATKATPNSLAGCCDCLWSFRYPESSELEAAFQEALDECKLRSPWEEHFPRTSPVWYSFWINSPLSFKQCEILLALFQHVFLADAEDLEEDISQF